MRSFRLALLLMITLPLWVYAQDAADQSLPKEFQRANTPKTDVIVPKSENQLKEFLNSVESMERHLAAQAQKHEAALRAVRQEVETTASSHVGYINCGLTGLALFTGLLGVLGVVITYLMARTYLTEIKNKKLAFEKCESEIKNLLEKAREEAASISDLLKRHELSDKFKQPVLEQAKEAIKNGKGLEVIWGFAILAQQNENWSKALSFWKSILQQNPGDRDALFGAAIACYNQAIASEENRENRVSLLEEGRSYLQNISDSEVNAPVLNNLGLILKALADNTLGQEERKILWDQAEETFRRATEVEPNLVAVWYNWGNVIFARFKDAREAAEKERLYQKAEETFRRATEVDPNHASAWSNWGNVIFARAKDAREAADKKRLRKQAEEKYRRATEVDPTYVPAWFNWGKLLANCAKDVREAAEKERLRKKAEEKYRRATGVDPTYVPAWFNWGKLLADCAKDVREAAEKERLRKKAEEKYRHATGVDPNVASTWFNWGNLLADCAKDACDAAEKERLRKKAEGKYRRATEINPKDAPAWVSWGILLANRARDAQEATDRKRLYIEAEEKFLYATHADPKDTRAWYGWGSLLFIRARTEKELSQINMFLDQAEEKFKSALEIDPVNFDALNSLAILLLYRAHLEGNQDKKSDLFEQTENLLERAAALGNYSSFYNLALLAAQQQQNERCIENLERAYANNALPDIKSIKANKDLDPVRDTEAFKAFIEKVLRERGW